MDRTARAFEVLDLLEKSSNWSRSGDEAVTGVMSLKEKVSPLLSTEFDIDVRWIDVGLFRIGVTVPGVETSIEKEEEIEEFLQNETYRGVFKFDIIPEYGILTGRYCWFMPPQRASNKYLVEGIMEIIGCLCAAMIDVQIGVHFIERASTNFVPINKLPI